MNCLECGNPDPIGGFYPAEIKKQKGHRCRECHERATRQDALRVSRLPEMLSNWNEIRRASPWRDQEDDL